MPRPADNGLMVWSFDPAIAQGTFTPSAGVLYVQSIFVRSAAVVAPANLFVVVSTAGTGATPLANCFCGIYTSAGSLVANSGTADQSTPWATTGAKTMAMTASQLLTPGSRYWVALLVGTQSTTNVVFRAGSSAAALNANLTASTFRGGSVSSGLSALPNSFTPGSLASVGTMWVAAG